MIKVINRNLQRISALLIVMWTTRFFDYFNSTLNLTFGLPLVHYTYSLFFLLPGIYIISYNIKNNRLILPFIIPFLVFFGTHYTMEKYFYDSDYIMSFDLLNRNFQIYLGYIFLINIDERYVNFKSILKFSVVFILLTIIMFLLSFIGVLDSGTYLFEDRALAKWNLNVVSDMAVLGLILYYLSVIKFKYLKVYNFIIRPWMVIVLTIVFISATGTRGSMLLFLLSVSMYFWYKWNYISKSLRVFIIIIFPLIVITINNQSIVRYLANKSLAIDRLVNKTDKEDTRYLQIQASINSFITSPIVGVGYNNAAKGFIKSFTRSNFQYGQILGSGGIVLFLVYFFYIYKLYFINFRNYSNVIIILMFLFVLVEFIFRRPESYFSLIAYVVYQENKFMSQGNKINKHSEVKI